MSASTPPPGSAGAWAKTRREHRRSEEAVLHENVGAVFPRDGKALPKSTTTQREGTKPPTAAAQRRCSSPVPLPPFPYSRAAWFTDLLVFVGSRARGACVRFAPSTAAFSPEPRPSSTSPPRGWTRSAMVGVVRAIALV
ncbi:hypothetical protein TcCL_NonESM01489, partial [Trypanosoma cruzi]